MTEFLIDPTQQPLRYAIFDIDGCVLNIDERLPHLLNGDLDTFLKNWRTDRPIPQGVYVYTAFLRDPSVRVIFSTARPEHARSITLTQLKMIFGDVAEFDLWMCPEEDHHTIGDVELKLNAIRRSGISPTDIFIAFDDRNCIVEAYRKMGICSYQTDTGY